MPRATKAPSHTANSAITAALNAAAPMLEPPAHCVLHGNAIKFWPGIIRARARDEWRAVDLVVAAQLANCQASIEAESALLQAEGTIMTNKRETPIANPRHGVLEALARREMALMRSLLMGGRALADPRSAAGARAEEHKANKAREQIEDEDVLA